MGNILMEHHLKNFMGYISIKIILDLSKIQA